jgi:hypothetical protein
VSIRHTASAKQNLENAHTLLGISHKYVEELNQCFNVLAKKYVSDAQVKNLVAELFKSETNDSTRIVNIREAVLASYYSGIGQSEIVGTAWGVLNGVTHYLSHAKDYKDADTKFENLVMDGQASKVSDKAAELLLEL